MIVQITNNVRITYAERNYTLEKRRVVQAGKNAGESQWDPVGYYASLDQAAVSLMKSHLDLLEPEVRQKTARDLQDIVDAVVDGARLIAAACQANKPSP